MICYKGNSFFRIFKIFIKYFDKKVNESFIKRLIYTKKEWAETICFLYK